ncbi:hypothetical protein ACFWIN_21405 [Streptomyces sp. NPDC127049]|uniref:hypothetical protein n=1 Tax=Streptomyces sp. NPDC127049 TaxID=3347118 RepID=UPI00364E5459
MGGEQRVEEGGGLVGGARGEHLPEVHGGRAHQGDLLGGHDGGRRLAVGKEHGSELAGAGRRIGQGVDEGGGAQRHGDRGVPGGPVGEHGHRPNVTHIARF